MKVSIVIPSYQQEQYLEQAIDSAIKQTIPAEVIVVDDGGKDGSLLIAQEYAKHGLIKLVIQVNKGLASARNAGIMNASGDYILPLDADDYLKNNCVEKIIEVATKTDADVIGPSIHCFGLGEETTILMESPTISDFKIRDRKCFNRLAYCSAIKRSVLLECGGYSPKMVHGYEDYHLWHDLLVRGKKIVTIPEPLVFYRTKQDSMWRDALKHHDELIEQIFLDFPQIYE